MVLGETLIDADGTRHKMAALLGLTTSFQHRKLHLGYRRLRSLDPAQTNPATGETTTYLAHEFHYSSTLEANGDPLFDAFDAQGTSLGQTGLRAGRVSGSFAHIIDALPIAQERTQA